MQVQMPSGGSHFSPSKGCKEATKARGQRVRLSQREEEGRSRREGEGSPTTVKL